MGDKLTAARAAELASLSDDELQEHYCTILQSIRDLEGNLSTSRGEMEAKIDATVTAAMRAAEADASQVISELVANVKNLMKELEVKRARQKLCVAEKSRRGLA